MKAAIEVFVRAWAHAADIGETVIVKGHHAALEYPPPPPCYGGQAYSAGPNGQPVSYNLEAPAPLLSIYRVNGDGQRICVAQFAKWDHWRKVQA